MDTTLVIVLVAVLVLLLLSGFFSGSETALTGASRARIHHLERRGNRRAAIVSRLIDEREALITTILIGNNLVNILASALATSVLIGFFGTAGVAYATIGMTLLIVIFAEILPKTYAIRYADRAALTVAPVLRGVVWLLSPLSFVIGGVVRIIMQLFGVKREAVAPLVSPAEEIRGAVSLHAREGGLVPLERAMIESIFDLADVEVGEVMVHRTNMSMLDADTPTPVIHQRLLESPFTRVPLWRGEPENIVGVLHVKDLLRAMLARGGEIAELDIVALAKEPWFVPETTTLSEQLKAFRGRGAHFALVVDEYGALMGLVTLEDIIEEIVGDITDEHDRAAAAIRKQRDGSCLVDGTVSIRDLNREFDWELRDEEAATVAGLVLHEAQAIPEVGQTFHIDGFSFEILRRRGNRITLLRIMPPRPAQEAANP